MADALPLYSEIVVPTVLMQGADVAQIERLLHAAGLLPAVVQDRRWRFDAERTGYLFSFTYALLLAPEEE